MIKEKIDFNVLTVSTVPGSPQKSRFSEYVCNIGIPTDILDSPISTFFLKIRRYTYKVQTSELCIASSSGKLEEVSISD